MYVFLGVVDLYYNPRILDFLPQRGNARHYQCMLDEDMVRRVTGLFHIFFCVFFYPEVQLMIAGICSIQL